MGNNMATCGEEAYNITLSKENRLGKGSFASVYKIERKIDKQILAAKIIESA
jgi:hypothetical protein